MPEKVNPKPIISIICAIARDRAIGKNNRLLWNIPEDLQHFRTITAGHPVIMGENTFYSIGRPLPQRVNIVLTKKTDLTLPGCVVCHSMEEAIEKARQTEQEPARNASDAGGEIFIIGGGQVYQQAISFADKLYLTIVEGEYDADTYFPDYSDFKKVISEEARDNGKYKFTYLELTR